MDPRANRGTSTSSTGKFACFGNLRICFEPNLLLSFASKMCATLLTLLIDYGCWCVACRYLKKLLVLHLQTIPGGDTNVLATALAFGNRIIEQLGNESEPTLTLFKSSFVVAFKEGVFTIKKQVDSSHLLTAAETITNDFISKDQLTKELCADLSWSCIVRNLPYILVCPHPFVRHITGLEVSEHFAAMLDLADRLNAYERKIPQVQQVFEAFDDLLSARTIHERPDGNKWLFVMMCKSLLCCSNFQSRVEAPSFSFVVPTCAQTPAAIKAGIQPDLFVEMTKVFDTLKASMAIIGTSNPQSTQLAPLSLLDVTIGQYIFACCNSVIVDSSGGDVAPFLLNRFIELCTSFIKESASLRTNLNVTILEKVLQAMMSHYTNVFDLVQYCTGGTSPFITVVQELADLANYYGESTPRFNSLRQQVFQVQDMLVKRTYTQCDFDGLVAQLSLQVPETAAVEIEQKGRESLCTLFAAMGASDPEATAATFVSLEQPHAEIGKQYSLLLFLHAECGVEQLRVQCSDMRTLLDNDGWRKIPSSVLDGIYKSGCATLKGLKTVSMWDGASSSKGISVESVLSHFLIPIRRVIDVGYNLRLGSKDILVDFPLDEYSIFCADGFAAGQHDFT